MKRTPLAALCWGPAAMGAGPGRAHGDAHASRHSEIAVPIRLVQRARLGARPPEARQAARRLHEPVVQKGAEAGRPVARGVAAALPLGGAVSALLVVLWWRAGPA